MTSEMDAVLESLPNEIRTTLKTLSDDTRLAIVLILLKRGEMSFSELCEVLKVPRNVLSHHLKVLSQAALVMNYYAKKEGIADYSFYDTTSLLRDYMDRLFGVIEPGKGATDALVRLLIASQSYAVGLGELLSAMQEYGETKEINSIALIRADETTLKFPLKVKEVK